MFASSPVLRRLDRARGCGFTTLSSDVFRFCEMLSRLIPTGLPRYHQPMRIFDGRKHQLFPTFSQPDQPSAILHLRKGDGIIRLSLIWLAIVASGLPSTAASVFRPAYYRCTPG